MWNEHLKDIFVEWIQKSVTTILTISVMKSDSMNRLYPKYVNEKMINNWATFAWQDKVLKVELRTVGQDNDLEKDILLDIQKK